MRRGRSSLVAGAAALVLGAIAWPGAAPRAADVPAGSRDWYDHVAATLAIPPDGFGEVPAAEAREFRAGLVRTDCVVAELDALARLRLTKNVPEADADLCEAVVGQPWSHALFFACLRQLGGDR